MKYEIKNRWTGATIYQDEAASLKALVEAAAKSRANLYGADLSGANLYGADLSRADLSRANLSRADLSGADLSRADLSRANLYGFFSFGPGGSRNAYTWARWEPEGYTVHCGCQTLPLKDFKAVVKERHGNSFHSKWYAANIKTMELVAKESEAAFRAAEQKREAQDGR